MKKYKHKVLTSMSHEILKSMGEDGWRFVGFVESYHIHGYVFEKEYYDE